MCRSIDDVRTYLKEHGKEIGGKAENGDVLCAQIVSAYDLLFRRPTTRAPKTSLSGWYTTIGNARSWNGYNGLPQGRKIPESSDRLEVGHTSVVCAGRSMLFHETQQNMWETHPKRVCNGWQTQQLTVISQWQQRRPIWYRTVFAYV